MSAAQNLIDRLERVRQVGHGRWLAHCPSHEDRSPSLSVRELDDGRALIHCFGGCETGDVLGALGMALADLFDRPLGHHWEPTHSRIPARDLLVIFDHELTVAVLILDEVVRRRTVREAQIKRLIQAANRVALARDEANPARTPNAA
jgi:CHC2 zinc finger